MLFGSIAIDNLIQNHKARFKPDPDKDGYLFFKDDYGDGVPCSSEQYEGYVSEFKS